MEQSVESIKSDYQMKLKYKQRALKRKFQVNVKTPQKVKTPIKRFKTQSSCIPLTSTLSVDFTMISAPTNSPPEKLSAALTPCSKKKSTSALKEKNLPESVKPDIWKDFGIKLSRNVPNHFQNKTNLALVIQNFFQRTGVVGICPNVKKKTKNPSNYEELNQIHYGH